ncbi:hypothetical protein NDU88_003879 [Pleurodeles waltl]|uniref:Uncharacterized protein n=1 Tax=Pleurodeles waltl TaxID=8319 RepID=A0AAV7WQN9_PLEWA|nr:hypothetical protein NDU88_003879 [Pleurodeles waltl]
MEESRVPTATWVRLQMPGTWISGSRALKLTTDSERRERSFPRRPRREKTTTNGRARRGEPQKKTRRGHRDYRDPQRACRVARIPREEHFPQCPWRDVA